MTEIIKTKFLCKNGSQTISKYFNKGDTWVDRFVEGKWYDGEYETYSTERYRLNNGWKRYWVINEIGEKEEISRSEMNAIFENNITELRDKKINEILDGTR
jgi:hypothetical protein